MRSICFFAAYFTERDIPYYVTVYLQELKKQFGELWLFCSQKDLSDASRRFLEERGIGFSAEKNEGYDFGLWYKALQKHNVEAYDQVALVNDSCVLFASLDGFMNWSRSVNGDLLGITASNARAPHIQSYFLVINKPAIQPVKDYFHEHKIIHDISEVIETYEVGMSTYLISKGLKLEAFMDNNGYEGEFSPYYQCVDYHFSKGVPLIKKKIIFSSYRPKELTTLARMGFNISVNHYLALIKTYNKQLILDLKKLTAGKASGMNPLAKARYQILKRAIAILRPLYKKMKHA